MPDNRNTILAVILSGLVLIGWQYFFNIPQMEKQRAAQQAQSEMVKPAPQAGSTTTPATAPETSAAPSAGAPAAKPPPARDPPGTPPRAIGWRASGKSPRLERARGQPRHRHCRDPANQDRHPAPFRQHFAERRAARRSVAGAIPRHCRPAFARDRAV